MQIPIHGSNQFAYDMALQLCEVRLQKLPTLFRGSSLLNVWDKDIVAL